jgi:hypothetical protein
MITSDTITSIAEALILFHKEVGKIKKNANNPFFKSKYAELSDIQEEIADPLINNGLIITQWPDGENTLTTRLIHRSGEWMQSSFDIHTIPEYLKEKDRDGTVAWRSEDWFVSPQAQGSAITYARRYAICAILNLSVVDDDGNEASGRAIPAKRQPAVSSKPLISKVQWDKALIRIDKGEKNLIAKLQESFALTAEQLSVLSKKK